MRAPAKPSQRGAALVVALLLLVVITLVGFAAVRGTLMQQKMAANHYDRQVAFQNAEAALRVARERIDTHPDEVARNCRSAAVQCLSNPFNDSKLPDGSIHDVLAGSDRDTYTKGDLAAGQPQYVIENMGNWADPDADAGFGQNASSHNYGVTGGSTTAVYYRITARSGAPKDVGDRAVVILQTVIKQR